MRIILNGYGVVGQSLTDIFKNRRLENLKNYGFNPKVVAITDRGGAAINSKGLDLERIKKVKRKKGTVAADDKFGYPKISAQSIIQSTEAEIMIEATSTNIINAEPGLSNIKTAFNTGKHVVTTNKGPLALAFPTLTELAEHNKVLLRFSGTVGGGTPILEFAKKCLAGDKINEMHGILNGTTNYILTEMAEKKVIFEKALESAQKLGYAETDPSMDINGLDAATKVVIIGNWIMNKKFTLKDVDIQGIRDVTLEELEVASKNGKRIKLIASIDGKPSVAPKEIQRNDPLCVSGVLNAVTFVSEYAGKQTIIGRGAGGIETASAILRDLLDIKYNLANKMLM
ncbi:homoserine dehydrogenase [Candidatus Bathyarchaeota archaeon]|nr:homoserine dehydrogenase [Candidatus Bathyarchaeota archaeon]